jgi:hypothetical protein
VVVFFASILAQWIASRVLLWLVGYARLTPFHLEDLTIHVEDLTIHVEPKRMS